MAIQVQGRVQAPQKQERPERDIWDKIMLGLQAANSVLGIKGHIEQSEMREFEKQRITRQDEIAAQQRTEAKQLDPFREAQLAQQGIQFSSGNEGPMPENAIRFETPSGEPRFGTPGMTIAQKATIDSQEKAARASAAKIAKEERNNKMKLEEGLRTDYYKASADTRQVISGWRKVKAAATVENPTGADDMALVYGFMKAQDPGSAVKEGEYATAENTTGKVDRYTLGLYNSIINGTRLTPEQRQNFLNAAARQVGAQLEMQKETDQYWRAIAERAGADVEDILDPRFEAVVPEINRYLGGGGQQEKPMSISDLLMQEKMRRAGQTTGGR